MYLVKRLSYLTLEILGAGTFVMGFFFFGSTFVMVLRGGGEEGKGFVVGQC